MSGWGGQDNIMYVKERRNWEIKQMCAGGFCNSRCGHAQTERETKLLYCSMFLFKMSEQGPRTRSNRGRSSLTHLRGPHAITVAARGRFISRAISPKVHRRETQPVIQSTWDFCFFCLSPSVFFCVSGSGLPGQQPQQTHQVTCMHCGWQTSARFFCSSDLPK